MDARYITKVKRRDRVARWLISLGGVSIIGSMLVMIIFMVKVTMPLFEDPSHELQSTFRLPIERGDLVLFEPGPYLENGLAITKDGSYHHFDLKKGEIKKTTALSSPSGSFGASYFTRGEDWQGTGRSLLGRRFGYPRRTEVSPSF